MKLYDVLMGTFHRWHIETGGDIGIDDARRLEAALDLWCASIQTGMDFPESWVDQAQSKAEEDANERRESAGLRPERMPGEEGVAATGTRDRIGRVVRDAGPNETVEIDPDALRAWLANAPPGVNSVIVNEGAHVKMTVTCNHGHVVGTYVDTIEEKYPFFCDTCDSVINSGKYPWSIDTEIVTE